MARNRALALLITSGLGGSVSALTVRQDLCAPGLRPAHS